LKIDEYIIYIEEITKNYTNEDILNQYNCLKSEISDEKNYIKELIEQLVERKAAFKYFDNSGIKYLLQESHGNVESFCKQAFKNKELQKAWNINDLRE